MPNAPTKNSRLGTIDRLHNHQTIDLKKKTEGADSEYGETIDSTTITEVDILVPTPSTTRDADFFGVDDTDLDIQFIMDNVVSVDGGGGRLASEIDFDRDGTFEYVVLTTIELQNGLQRVAGTNIDFEG